MVIGLLVDEYEIHEVVVVLLLRRLHILVHK
jgi:hypothetical protein